MLLSFGRQGYITHGGHGGAQRKGCPIFLRKPPVVHVFCFRGGGGRKCQGHYHPSLKIVWMCDFFGLTCVGEVFVQEHTRTIFAFSLLEIVLKLFQIMKSCCAFEKAGLRVAKQGISVASIPIPECCQWTSVALYILHVNDRGLMADGDGKRPSQQVVFVGKNMNKSQTDLSGTLA